MTHFIKTKAAGYVNVSSIKRIYWDGNNDQCELTDGMTYCLADGLDEHDAVAPIGVVSAPPEFLLWGFCRGRKEDRGLWSMPIIAFRIWADDRGAEPVCLEIIPSNYAVQLPSGVVILPEDREFETLEAFKAWLYSDD